MGNHAKVFVWETGLEPLGEALRAVSAPDTGSWVGALLAKLTPATSRWEVVLDRGAALQTLATSAAGSTFLKLTGRRPAWLQAPAPPRCRTSLDSPRLDSLAWEEGPRGRVGLPRPCGVFTGEHRVEMPRARWLTGDPGGFDEEWTCEVLRAAYLGDHRTFVEGVRVVDRRSDGTLGLYARYLREEGQNVPA